MKKRIFYIVHLDKERIILLSTIFIAVLISSFTIGYKLGKDNHMQDASSIQIESPITTKTDIEIKEEQKSTYNLKPEKKEIIQKNKTPISVEELKKAEKVSISTSIVENDTEIEIPKEEKKEEWKVYKRPYQEKKLNNKEEKYMIQISAHKSEEVVKKLKNKLEENGIKSYYNKKNKYYILYTTTNSSEESKEIKEKLKSLNIEKVIIKKLNN